MSHLPVHSALRNGAWCLERRGSAIIIIAPVWLSRRSAAHHAGLAIGHVKLEHGAAGGSIQQGYGGQLRFGRCLDVGAGLSSTYIQDAHTAVREAGQQPCTMPLCCYCARRTRFGAGRVDSLASCLPSPACFPSWQPSTPARIGCHHRALERHPRLWRQATRAACQNTTQADT